MAWVTPLVVMVVGVLVLGVIGVGPFGGLGNPPVSATTRVGDFELTIQSARSRYVAGEPIDISASLTYLGSGGPVEVGYDIGEDGAPIGFGVSEPIFGGYHLSGDVSRLTCHRSTLAPRQPINEAFRKTGAGFDGDVVGFTQYMADPVFWLAAGMWHPYATVQFSIGSCGADVDIRAEISIDVLAPAKATDQTPQSSADRSTSSVTEGDFELTLTAAKPTFTTNEPLDVMASLTYLGPEESIVIHHQTWGPLGFGMWAPGITLNPRGRMTCSDLEMSRGVPITEPLLDLGKNGTPFAVAHGLHEVTATAQFSRGSCSAPSDAMETSILVAVADGPDDIPLLTDEAGQGGACLLLRNGGRLANSNSGLGVVTFDGTLRDVVWPNGYSARRTADGAVLLGRDGQVIAQEGDEIEFDANTSEGQPLRPCGDVTAIQTSPPTEAPSSTSIDLPPSLPVPTDSADAPVYGSDDDGWAVLQVKASHASYVEGTPIDLEAKYWFADGQALVASHCPPELLLSITQLDAINPTGRGASYDGACTDLGRIDGTEHQVVLTGSNIAFIRGDRVPARLDDLFVGGALVLPVGRWEINANVEGRFAPCGQAGDGYALSASILIEVLPG